MFNTVNNVLIRQYFIVVKQVQIKYFVTKYFTWVFFLLNRNSQYTHQNVEIIEYKSSKVSGSKNTHSGRAYLHSHFCLLVAFKHGNFTVFIMSNIVP